MVKSFTVSSFFTENELFPVSAITFEFRHLSVLSSILLSLSGIIEVIEVIIEVNEVMISINMDIQINFTTICPDY